MPILCPQFEDFPTADEIVTESEFCQPFPRQFQDNGWDDQPPEKYYSEDINFFCDDWTLRDFYLGIKTI